VLTLDNANRINDIAKYEFGGRAMTYLKGIYYALRGRVEIDSYDCVPCETTVDIDEFAERVEQNYSEALELLAE